MEWSKEGDIGAGKHWIFPKGGVRAVSRRKGCLNCDLIAGDVGGKIFIFQIKE